MSKSWGLVWTVVIVAAVALAAWVPQVGGMVRASIASGHLAEWVAGVICLAWLLLVLKVPWDLYFEAHAVVFEMHLSRERGLPVPAARLEYVRRVRRQLAMLAVGLHLVSAAVAALVALRTGSTLAYWIAALFGVTTAVRPAAAGYVYLSRKLRLLADESRYPREDAAAMREELRRHEQVIRLSADRLDDLRAALQTEEEQRQADSREVRQAVHGIGRELERTVSRLTDNQEVIRGIQAFVRLVAQSTQ